jgi:hypothetical protein
MEKLAQRLASLNQQFIGDFKSLEKQVDMINSEQSPDWSLVRTTKTRS